MPDPIIKGMDSAGQTVVIAKDKVTHLVSAGEMHTEVYLVGGTYVRIRGSVDETTSGIWSSDREVR